MSTFKPSYNENTPEDQQHCGFVAVIGLANAGKSTLINGLVGGKVSIVSRKVQTTRNRILGIAMHDSAQIVLIDTPGVFKPNEKQGAQTLDRAMLAAAWDSMQESDCIIHLVDASVKNAADAAQLIINRIKRDVGKKNTKVLLVLNKIDDTPKERLLKLAQGLNEAYDYDATFMIAGLKRYGVDMLMDYLRDNTPQQPWMFPHDQLSDQPMRFMAAEITREKIYDRLHKELPYAAMVDTYEWEDFDNGDLKISQNILIQRPSQKAIVLGKGGSSIKEIGKMARMELEELLGRKVHLKLFVKVEKNWPDKPQFYTGPGLEYPGSDS